MDRTQARRLLAVALLIGIVAELLLRGPAVGINVPLVVALVIGAAWLLRRRGRAPIRWMPGCR